MIELIVFAVCAVIVLGGAVGVIASRNPVHAALSLVATLFGIAVLFIALDANFLAAVQVIVYTGAIVVLILFVLMLLGVDRTESLSIEPIAGQRFLAAVIGLALVVLVGAALVIPWVRSDVEHAGVENIVVTGERSATAPLVADPASATSAANTPAVPDQSTDTSGIERIGESLFTDYVFAFEVTAAMLTIAVVGAVLLARRPSSYEPLPPDPDEVGEAEEITEAIPDDKSGSVEEEPVR